MTIDSCVATFFDAMNHLQPLKSVYSSQEWCGSTYEQINWLPTHAMLKIQSYFEGASIQTKLPVETRLTDSLLVYGELLRRGPAFTRIRNHVGGKRKTTTFKPSDSANIPRNAPF